LLSHQVEEWPGFGLAEPFFQAHGLVGFLIAVLDDDGRVKRKAHTLRSSTACLKGWFPYWGRISEADLIRPIEAS